MSELVMILNSLIKEGTLVKFKSKDELLGLNHYTSNGMYINRYSEYKADKYANRIALIVKVIWNDVYSFEVYFPDNGDTYAWAYEDEFEIVEDLLKDYRKGEKK